MIRMNRRWPAMVWVCAFSVPGVFAQDGDGACAPGWEAVVQGFLSAELDHNVSEAAMYVTDAERETWASWKSWEWARRDRRIAEMPESVQERAVKESEQARKRLEVSVLTCMSRPDGNGFFARVDPDGRSYQTVDLNHADGGWSIETGMRRMDAEQIRVVTAYFKAADEERWDEAEAWVARSALPRFTQYRAEVALFLSGSEAIAQARRDRAAERAVEWKEMFLRATREEDDILIVYAEFPTAQSLSVEMLSVDGTWRVLLR